MLFTVYFRNKHHAFHATNSPSTLSRSDSLSASTHTWAMRHFSEKNREKWYRDSTHEFLRTRQTWVFNLASRSFGNLWGKDTLSSRFLLQACPACSLHLWLIFTCERAASTWAGHDEIIKSIWKQTERKRPSIKRNGSSRVIELREIFAGSLIRSWMSKDRGLFR